MKTTLVVSAVLLIINLEAQERPFCLLNATTLPGASHTQEQLLSLPINNETPDTRFLNNWAWWGDPLNSQWPQNVTLNGMQMATNDIYENTMEPLNSLAYEDHYLYVDPEYGELMHPQNGWELLAFNRGWYPDNVTPVDWGQNNALRSIPYVLLYNKYRGIARVFFRYGNNTGPSDATNFAVVHVKQVPIEESENPLFVSGLLRLSNGLDQSLNQQTITTSINVRIPSPGQAEIWWSADFQLAYDPCVCAYPSQISLSFEFFNTASLQATGLSITAQEEFATIPFMQDFETVHEYFAALRDNDPNPNENGVLIYKKMNDLYSSYLDRLKVYKKKLGETNIQNQKIDETEAILKIAQALTTLGVTAITGMPEYSSLLSLIPSVKAQKDSDTFGSETQKAFWKALDKALGVGFELLIKDDLKRKSTPEMPVPPSVSFSEMQFSGTLGISIVRNTYPLNTPGSKNSNQLNTLQPTQYPLYDESLGIFALLEKPKVLVSQTILDEFTWNYEYSHPPSEPGDHVRSIYKSWTRNFQYKLAEPLKYTLNPALKVVSSDIEIAFEIESRTVQLHQSDPVNYDCFIDPLHSANFNSLQVDLNQFSLIQGHTRAFNQGLSEFYNLMSDQDPNRHPYVWAPLFTASLPSFRSTSEFVPVDAFLNFKSSLAIKNQYANYVANYGFAFDPDIHNSSLDVDPNLTGFNLDQDIYIKVKLNITFEGTNQSGNPLEYNYLFTYQVLPEDVIHLTDDLFQGLGGSDDDFTQNPENLLFNGTSFNGAPIDGCSLDGNTYFCKAWNDISLLGNITVANNHEVIFEAGNEVVVFPDATVPTEATLRLNSPFDFSDPMPMATAEYVTNFCSGLNPKYMANQDRFSATSPQDSLHQAAVFAPQAQQAFAFDVYPNPTNNSAQVKLSLPSNAITTLRILELSGKVVSTPIENAMLSKGDVLENLPSESLLPGIYLIQVTVDEQRFVKRFIKL